VTSKRICRSALVLSGGGARGAYETGVLHYLRTMLPPKLSQNLKFNIHSGSSVGAINATFMASMAHDPLEQGKQIVHLWKNLKTSNIYRRGPVNLGKLVFRSTIGVLSHLIGLRGFKEPNDRSLHFQGFFDTQPFFHFLRQHMQFQNVGKNIENGTVDAVVVSATNMLTGQLELFLQKGPQMPLSERMQVHVCKLSPRHIMASAALPLLFPPVPIHGLYYNDGGMRLNTPLAPAVSLGAARILIVGTRYRPTLQDLDTQVRTAVPRKPTLGDVLGKLYHAILLDRLDSDRDQVDRINRILAACASQTSKETYHEVCEKAGVQQIETLTISPSMNISSLVDETVRGNLRNLKTLGIMERFVLRLLEADPISGNDFLSYFLFEPIYLQKLIDLGFEDARNHHDQLATFAERAIQNTPID